MALALSPGAFLDTPLLSGLCVAVCAQQGHGGVMGFGSDEPSAVNLCEKGKSLASKVGGQARVTGF